MRSQTIELACELIRHRSITPEDAGCQSILIKRLEAAGFIVERMKFENVENFWARHGSAAPLLVLAGHTDVVPTGPEDVWQCPPFEPEVRDGQLLGRGAADMKGPLAAMVTAAERFVKDNPDHPGSVALLITGDEEGLGVNGTVKVVLELSDRGEKIDYCIVGEPSSVNRLGDTIKNGRRGSLTGKLTVKGIQGHVAYPDRASNPIHKLAPALTELVSAKWDQGNEYFQPTSFQISNIHGGTGADNVIPGTVEVLFNFRFSPAVTPEELQTRVENTLHSHKLEFELNWRVSGKPFLTQRGRLTDEVNAAVKEFTGIEPELSTSGGTSDGRFIAPLGADVVELGPINATIHKVNESVSADDLDVLSKIYERIIQRILLR
jgi:succinyl-diaminopimelate desuccinylase